MTVIHRTHRVATAVAVAILLAGCGSVAPAQLTPAPGPVPTSNDPGKLTLRLTPDLSSPPPFLADRVKRQNDALKLATPIMLLDAGLDDLQRAAQEAAIRDGRFVQYIRAQDGAPLRNEIFQILPARDSDITAQTSACKAGKCYRVEMYNFATNLTSVAIVDAVNRAALSVNHFPGIQPDIPPALTDLATQIAINAPEVQDALGFKPTESDALMASTKTALNRTRCERSRHLCVAPTFVKGDRALWAIVDLTDNTLVGVRWTHTGKTGLAVTERKLQDVNLTREFCNEARTLERDGWALNYVLTSSDGLRVGDLTFNGKPVARSVKMVDWHVSYSSVDGFGYSDAVGCPYFSQSAVIAIEPPQVNPIVKDGKTVGFSIDQRYQSEGWPTPCNYNYRQRFEFYQDGRFRPVIASVGRGCGNDGIYRPVTRIAMHGDANTFAEYAGGGWTPWTTEQWQLQTRDLAYTPEGYRYRIADAAGQGFYVEPNRGQFGDGSRGDFAWTYITRHDGGRDEGESDLMTVGPCCNNDYRQGPEKFIEPAPEPIEKSSLVMWYVAQMKNDNTPGREYCWAESVLENGVYSAREFPCYTGPMFVPIAAGASR
jgi:hypothetical protein